MKKLRRASFVLASAALLTGMLSACGTSNDNSNNGGNAGNAGTTNEGTNAAADNGGNAATNDAPANDASTKKITISIYYPTPDLVEKRALEDDKIKRFNEKYPNVEIVKSDWQYNPNEIGIKMGANEAPTLFNTYATEGKFLAERGWAADITDLFNAYEFKDQMNPILQNQFIIDGKVYGIAQQGYVTGTVVNKKMLDDKGVAVPSYDWTWDDMLNTAKAVADTKKGISGIAPMGKGNESGWNWTNFLFEAGGEIQTVDGGKVTAAFNSDAGVKALEFYHKLAWEANAIPKDFALGWGDAVGAWAQGRTAMVIAGPDGPVDQGLNQGGMKPEDILVYPMPKADASGKHTGVLGGDFLVINPNATKDEQEMAFRYATFDYFSDKGLESVEASIQQRKTDGKFFVPPVIQYFTDSSDYGQKVKAVYDKYDNVYQYSPEIMSLLDGKPEAQFNTQDYYAEMTLNVQSVFSKKDVDIKASLDNSAKKMQEKFYDNIKVQ
ncbi:ABC transporter substrate-binding protein [Paenibacillus sacheonensis]|uniref:ABC transporter substrate-binding protein n=1 Tax=Paenibacillus sacheonensis TaxID=742054 RepID=A0A7X4YNK3_9BACL|nr:extracellular solute-binding protein [Paenibacillus sacheonensis]MBM7565962.1 ABC-type glycerol-3-phosphate transport system substrate-binding protein [Paenibacillus sacheonensis]NBC68724.1 ABC transporter substrate-binding protein [Paenibacillus sacheonensis]